MLKLPYTGQIGNDILKRYIDLVWKNSFQDLFPLKDNENKHDVVYNFNCSECTSLYIGESGRRYAKRIHDHLVTDKSPMYTNILLPLGI